MSEHPIGKFMETTMQKIREMVDVNTIVGTPIETTDGITLIPVSKVSFGFAGGGSDFQTKNHQNGSDDPFGGGSGAGVRITPVAFLVIKDGCVSILNVAPPVSTTADRIVDMAPGLLDRIETMIEKSKNKDK